MKVTVSAPEPLILREAAPGDLFLVHAPDLADGVFALLSAGDYTAAKNHHDVVCVGSRVGELDHNYIAAGSSYSVHLDSPITLLEQVEPASFRARRVPDFDPADQTDAAMRPRAKGKLEAAHRRAGYQAQPEPITRL